eukprot:gnl/MRDRNA2_/MRDRNA2_19297_c0_seq2.p1 gnl/MRDRNA2_/MRDRNA2_19297_c0~~gnl/MRDRNA2_/MRDRNA2_19297_c0_seq2.p1  ORF type:complete len:194 (-),score=36.74 gnl/MRDRNA2_/MRDRNA2_19297_c0_seq2:356-937(-)
MHLLLASVALTLVIGDEIDDMIDGFAKAMHRFDSRKGRLSELQERCPEHCHCGTLAQHLRNLRRDQSDEGFGEPPNLGKSKTGQYYTSFYPPATFWGCEWVVDCELPHTDFLLKSLPKIDGDCVELYGQWKIGKAIRNAKSNVAAQFAKQLNIKRIRVLDASGLDLKQLPENAFHGWSALRFLALDSNRSANA